MARVFVRLKLALLANGFRRGWQQAVGTVLAIVYAAPVALFASRGAAILGRRADAVIGEQVLVVGFAVVWLGWIGGPLLAFGMDETLDPRRLALLPLRRGQLLRGLLAASSVGIGPFAMAIVLYGVVIGFARVGPAGPVVLVAVAVQFLLCVGIARAVTTALSRRLSSRRGRDTLVMAAALLGLVVAGLAQLPKLLLGGGSTPSSDAEALRLLDRVATGLTVLPPAWPARAIGAAVRGNAGVAALWLAAAVAAIAAVLWWWSVALHRSLGAGEQAREAADDAELFPGPFRWLPRTRLGAGVAKDLRYAWRVPQLRVQYLMLGVLLVGSLVLNAGRSPIPAMVLLAPLALLVLGITGFNGFGADRGAVWILDMTGPRPRTDLAAKAAAMAALGLPIAAVIAVVLAAVSGGWTYVPAAVVVAAGVQAVVATVGAVVSVVAPFPLPDSPTHVFAANAGVGCASVLLQAIGLIVQLVLLAPIAVGVAVAVGHSLPAVAAAAAASLAWGALLWWLGLRIAARRWHQRRTEFVAALQPRTG